MSGYYVHNPNVHKDAGGVSGFGEQGQEVHNIADGQYRSNKQQQDKNKDQKTGQDKTANTKTEATPVYFWRFEDAGSTSQSPSYSQSMPSVHDTDKAKVESIVNTVDGRTPVDLDDYQKDDGKFRAIVKLFLLYEGQINSEVTEDTANWAMATGWLVSADVVVTAGHCAYNHSRGLGRLIKVKAYMGYTGSESVDSDQVQFRSGLAIATTEKWIDVDLGDEPSDVSFIKLSKPFESVSKYFIWTQTPISQKNADLGVVGYPGDIVNDKGERGAKMYQMFKRTDYNLETSYLHMLQYRIDTYGGNSGSCVFNDRKSLSVIGVHVLGGYRFNSASVITGTYGNRFQAFVNVASSITAETTPPDSIHPDDKKPWLWKCRATTTESADDDPVKRGLNTTKQLAAAVNSDIPKKILDYDSPISFGSTAGSQISILASAAIAAAGRLAADSGNESNVESLANSRAYDGILGRSIVAEAALRSFYDMQAKDQELLSESIGPIVACLKPFVLKIAPKILKGILEPSMRLLLSHLASGLDIEDKRTGRTESAEKDTGFGRKLTKNEDIFLKGLVGSVELVDVESFYSTLSTIGDVIGSAFTKAGPVLLDVAKLGLPLLLGTESEGLPTKTNLDPLAHRAILAEACLQAHIAMSEKDLKKFRVFKKMIGSISKFGPQIMKASPFVVKFIGPVVADVLRELNDKKKQEFLDFTYGKS